MTNLQEEINPVPPHSSNPAPRTDSDESGRANRLRSRRIRQLIDFLLVSVLLFNLGLKLVPHPDVPHYPKGFEPNTLAFPLAVLLGYQWNDSLNPMLRAIHFLRTDPHAPVYETIFFHDHVKFQYPLPSVLPYYELEKWGVSDRNLMRLSRGVIDLTFCVTILLSIWLAFRLLEKQTGKPATRRETFAIGLSLGLAGVAFNPVVSAPLLGQIQTLLTLGFTLAFLFWLMGKEAWAGAILGLMTLVKPQYGVFLLWALLRRKFSAAFSGLACGVAGLAASCAVFGLNNNFEYIRVLQYIGRRGEYYYPNESVNGILNRLVGHVDFMLFDEKFAPENAFVFWCTMASTLFLLFVALFFPWGEKRRGGACDFACILLVSTMASPIAWDHHYGILFPTFVWLWFGDYAWRESRWDLALIAAAYFLTSNVITPALALTNMQGWNLLTSNLYFGAILVLVLLFRSETGSANKGAQKGVGRESSLITA